MFLFDVGFSVFSAFEEVFKDAAVCAQPFPTSVILGKCLKLWLLDPEGRCPKAAELMSCSKNPALSLGVLRRSWGKEA